MVASIIMLLIIGFIVGAIARLLMPGRDPLGILGTIVLVRLGARAPTPSTSRTRSLEPAGRCLRLHVL